MVAFAPGLKSNTAGAHTSFVSAAGEPAVVVVVVLIDFVHM